MKVNDEKVHKEYKCFFWKTIGHFNKDCPKRKAWIKRKGTYHVSVCFESNLIEVPNNTWWLDSRATTHVPHDIQGFLLIQHINRIEQFLYMSNIMKAQIEVSGLYRLILDPGCCWDLEIFYIPDCARNLVSIRRMDNLGFTFMIRNNVFSLYTLGMTLTIRKPSLRFQRKILYELFSLWWLIMI